MIYGRKSDCTYIVEFKTRESDEQGGFFKHPSGIPRSKLVTPNERHAEEPEVRPAATVPAGATAKSHIANTVRQLWALWEHTAQLLKANEQLRRELSSVCLASEAIQGSHSASGLARAG
jgi:hypothetical protein